jgi:hypothetical protein
MKRRAFLAGITTIVARRMPRRHRRFLGTAPPIPPSLLLRADQVIE